MWMTAKLKEFDRTIPPFETNRPISKVPSSEIGSDRLRWCISEEVLRIL
jgi:hypothetical protein